MLIVLSLSSFALCVLSLVLEQHKTIDAVLERGVKLDELVERSNDLSSQSKLFYKQVRLVNESSISHRLKAHTCLFLTLPYVQSRYLSAG